MHGLGRLHIQLVRLRLRIQISSDLHYRLPTGGHACQHTGTQLHRRRRMQRAQALIQQAGIVDGLHA